MAKGRSGRAKMNAVRRLSLSVCALLLSMACAAQTQFYDVGGFTPVTGVTAMVYSPAYDTLVLKNSASTIVVVELASMRTTLRFANTNFTDLALSPSGRYVFGADYGGENIGYGTPAATSYVHRYDLANKTWEQRRAYIAGHVQAVSDTQVILKSIDQWVTFTNNAWGTGLGLIPLNTPSNSSYWGPSYYPGVYYGNFRYDVRSGRLLHGNSGSSSQEVQAFKIASNEFVKQEGSGTYGSAQGHGGTTVLATDSSAFYYGDLQVDPLDVTHNIRTFQEKIYAATGQVAFGNGTYYDAHDGQLIGVLPFATTVYALNPKGTDFWAYDPATSTIHHFSAFPWSSALVYKPLSPCRIADTRNATLASGVQGPLAGNILYRVPGFVTSGQNWSAYGGAAESTGCGLTDPPGSAIYAVALVATMLNPSFDAFLGISDVNDLNAVLSSVALNYSHGQGLSTLFIVPQISSNSIYFAMPAGLSANLILDVVGYYAIADSTLQCTSQASAPLTIAGSGASDSVASPACSAGYTLTGGSCDSTSQGMRLTQDKATGANTAWLCAATNAGALPADLTATATCCRIPGR